MHSPEVLKAIYALEHGQSVDRMAQTLLQFGVTRAEIEVLLNDTGDGHTGIAVGTNWAPLAERIACERAARGWPVVSLEMLRRATTTSARVETVRIHAQNRRISLVGSAPSPTPSTPVVPPPPVSLEPRFASPQHSHAPHGGSAEALPPATAPARSTIVAVSKNPFSAVPVPASLLRDLERAAQLLKTHPSIEFTLPASQTEVLRNALRAFVDTAEELAAPPPAPVAAKSGFSLSARPNW
jgi:hypothetical protein